jgi:hypothetical protein
VLLYAVLAGASPLAFAATIAVMEAGRRKALAFGAAFVLAQLVMCSLLVGLGIAATGSGRKHYPGVEVVLEIAVVAGLIWLARRVQRVGLPERRAGGERTHKLVERLGRVHLTTALGAGLALGIVSPKRLVLAGLAATAIDTSGVGSSLQGVLIVVYVGVSTALVWIPVAVFVVLGDRSVALMKQAQSEVARRQPRVTINALLLLAAVFAIDAIVVLLTHFA